MLDTLLTGGTPSGRSRSLADECRGRLVPTPPLPGCEVCVVIPARDEQARIERTLAQLTRQTGFDGAPLDPARYEVIVLANNCRDGTAAAVRRLARATPGLPPVHLAEVTLPACEAHVGSARRLLMDEARRRLRLLGRGRGIIATTDADTRAAPTWIAATLAEVARGADAVGGRAVLDPVERAALPRGVRERHLRDLGYRRLVMEYASRVDPEPWDPWPRHHQHFGASFAATVDAYERAGGLPALPAREDDAFYAALLRVDARFRHSPAVRVTTSARAAGRADLGLAAQLRDWEALDRGGLPFLVEPASAVAARLRGRAALRALWVRGRQGDLSWRCDVRAVAAHVGLSIHVLEQMLDSHRYFGELWEAVAGRQVAAGQSHGTRLVDVAEATAGLRALLGRT